MLTKQQALTEREFHAEHAPAAKIDTWRRNGATQTWVTRPEDFRLPVKYGLRQYGNITQANAYMYHAASDCPTRHVRVSLHDGAVEYDGIITMEHRNPDGQLNGIVRVSVTRRGTSRHRVGSEVDVGTMNVTDL